MLALLMEIKTFLFWFDLINGFIDISTGVESGNIEKWSSLFNFRIILFNPELNIKKKLAWMHNFNVR